MNAAGKHVQHTLTHSLAIPIFGRGGKIKRDKSKGRKDEGKCGGVGIGSGRKEATGPRFFEAGNSPIRALAAS